MHIPIEYKAVDRQEWIQANHTRRLAKAIRASTLPSAEAEFRVACEKTVDPKVAAAYATLMAAREVLKALEGGFNVTDDAVG